MSWILAFVGFSLLIVLHELGHFAVAKKVGMRVERFALFFPPLLARRKRGETEYAIGAIPLGGYVKISGMSPHEQIPPEHAHRAYFRQPVWKRIAVILAGPMVNIVLAFLILWLLFWAQGIFDRLAVDSVERGSPATGQLQPGDVFVSIDGVSDPARFSRQIASHRCAGRVQTGNCEAQTPARIVVRRDGREMTLELRPRYDPERRRARLGFAFAPVARPAGPVEAAGASVDQMWFVTTTSLRVIARIFDPEQRKQLSGVVGSYETTRQAVKSDLTLALQILALISLSLGVINLFPFLPLDGGHIFWALAEKVRGRPIPFGVLERAGFVGFALVLMLFFVGLSNDIDRLAGEGFAIR